MLLNHYFRYLTGIQGGSKGEKQANEMVKDFAKFIKFASPTKVNFEVAIDRKAVMEYVDKLRELQVGPSGQVNKLQVIILAINWLISQLPDVDPTPADKERLHIAMLCRDKLQAAKKSIAKEKVCFVNKFVCVSMWCYCMLVYSTCFIVIWKKMIILQKLQAAKKKEFLGDNMDMEASTKAVDFLKKASVSTKIDRLLAEESLGPENSVLVRR